jgi:hypothetical protein
VRKIIVEIHGENDNIIHQILSEHDFDLQDTVDKFRFVVGSKKKFDTYILNFLPKMLLLVPNHTSDTKERNYSGSCEY